MDQATFDKMYEAHQPPQVQALFKMEPFSQERKDAAMELASQGFTIDARIEGEGGNAYWTMLYRALDGFGWVASALQPQSLGPGITFPVPGFVPYTDTPPAGSIIVIDPRTATAEQLPPFNPPAPPVPVNTDLVGGPNPLRAGWWLPGPGSLVNGKPVVVDGQRVEKDGAEYVAHVGSSLMGVPVLMGFTQS